MFNDIEELKILIAKGVLTLPFLSRYKKEDLLELYPILENATLRFLEYHTACLPDKLSLARLLAMSPNLVYLSLRAPKQVPSSLLRQLEVLDITESEHDNAIAIIKKTPYIKTLRIGYIEHNYLNSHSLVNTLPTLRKLDTLSLYGSVSHELILSILKKAPNIKHICLGEYDPKEESYTNTLLQDAKNLLSHPEFTHYRTKVSEKSILSIQKRSTLAPYFHPRETFPSFLKDMNTYYQTWFKREHQPPLNRYTECTSKKIVCLHACMNDLPDSYVIERVFFAKKGEPHPCPSLERINIFSDIRLSRETETGDFTFTLNASERSLVDCHIPHYEQSPLPILAYRDTFQSNTEECFYASHTLQKTLDWQPLPSLSANDTITHLSIDGLKESDYTIQYCQKADLYYIKTTKLSDACVHFSVVLPKKVNTDLLPLPKPILDKIAHFKSFKQAVFPFDDNTCHTEKSYIDRLYSTHIGPCSFRAILFTYIMQQEHPDYPTRLDDNLCHDDVEINIHGQWQRINLGGYPAELIIKNENPLEEIEEPEETVGFDAMNQPLKQVTSQLFSFCLWEKDKSATSIETPSPIQDATRKALF